MLPVLAALLLAAGVAAHAWEGTVFHVQDGDSFRARRGHRVETIRLYGIDAPEHDQAAGQAAKRLAEALVGGKKIAVTPLDTDRYGRTVALAEARGVLVNAELVRAGLAWVCPHYCKAQPLCSDLQFLQETARQRRLGLWGDDRPVPPWVWKRRQ
jgi:endonuclease YncB( thermonuclease family)